MKIATAAEMKAQFSTYLESSKKGPVVVTRNGKPVAILLAVHDEEQIERLILSCSPEFQALLSTARKGIKEGQGIPHKEFWEQMERKQRSKPSQRARKRTAASK